VILSFLGGIRWGLAIVDDEGTRLSARLVFSICPALLEWVRLLLPQADGLALVAASFVVMPLADLRLQAAPACSRRQRLPLSVGATGALLLGLVH
jgi:hypothetical protein